MMQRPWVDEWLPRSTCHWAGGGDVGSSEGGFASSDSGGGWGGSFGGGFGGSSEGGGFYSGETGGGGGGFQASSGDGFQSSSGESGSQYSSDSGSRSDSGTSYSDSGTSYSDSGTSYSDSGTSYSDSGTSYSDSGGYYSGPGDYSGQSPSAIDSVLGDYTGGQTTTSYDTAGGGPFGEPSTTGQGGPFGNQQSQTQDQGGPFGGFQTSQPTISMPTTDPSNPLSPTNPLSTMYESEFGPNSLAGQLGYANIGRDVNQQVSTPLNINPDLATQLGINQIGNIPTSETTNQSTDAALNQAMQQESDQSQAQQTANQSANQLAAEIAGNLGRDTTVTDQFQNITAPLDITSPMAPAYAPFSPGENIGGAGRGATGPFDAPAPTVTPTMQENVSPRSEAPSLMDMLNPVSQAYAQNLNPTDLISSTQFNQSLNELGAQYGRNAQTLDDLARGMDQYYQDSRNAAEQLQGQQQSNTAAKGDFAGPYGRGGATFNYDFAQNFNPNNLQASLDYAPPRGNIDPTLDVYQAQPMAPPNQFTGQPSLAQDNQTPGKGDLFGTPQQTAQQALNQTQFDINQQPQQTQTPGWLTNLTNDPNLMSTIQGFNPNTLSWAVPAQTALLPDSMLTTQQQQARTAYDPALDPSVNPFAPPGWYGPSTTFQARDAPETARPVDVPTPVANPLSPEARGYFQDVRGPERGIDPQDRDAVARAVERAVTERAPVVERETGRAPLYVTVPGRAPTTTSTGRGGAFNPANVSRGQLDSLLNSARTAPTLAGRIAALDQLNGIISAMRSAGLPNPFGRDPDPNIAAALRQGR